MRRNLNDSANYGHYRGSVQHGQFNQLGQNGSYGHFNTPGQNVNYVQFNYPPQNNNFAQVNGAAMVGNYGQHPQFQTYGQHLTAQFLPSGQPQQQFLPRGQQQPPQFVSYGQHTGQSNLQNAYGR